MTIPFAGTLDTLSRWRASMLARLGDLSRFLDEHELCDAACGERVHALRQRLASDKVVLAFVAESSRGKSELINAIFFADTGCRVLPAAPGRTTMCPVELAYDAEAPPSLALLPIETRLDGLTIAELRGCAGAWTKLLLMGRAADQLAEAVAQVMRTQWVALDRARALGLWHDERPDDNPPLDAQGRVEVPVWRHALINYPHPLLQRGLVVLDTPGLNALGAEPELTLGLLPSAQATVFVLAADAGVTRSDLALWREHLGPHSPAHYVVLNKIDTLRDPLLTPQQVGRQIEAQRQAAASTLEVEPQCVFAVSAREALTARVTGDAQGLADSRLLELEQALGSRLLHQRQLMLQRDADEASLRIQALAAHGIGERRRQVAEQTLELRGLRGKSSARLRAVRERLGVETAEFEQCVVQIQALRAVHCRTLRQTLDALTSESLRGEVAMMQQALQASLLKLNAKKAFASLCARLREQLAAAQRGSDEIHAMLGASYARLNAGYGLGLSLEAAPGLQRFFGEIDLIERSYLRFLSPAQALRLAQAGFMDQFRRMLVSRLRVVFESACAEIELWSRTAASRLNSQLGERRRNFGRRSEALERVKQAAGELELRIAELETQDARLRRSLQRLGVLAGALRMPGEAAARPDPTPAAGAGADLRECARA